MNFAVLIKLLPLASQLSAALSTVHKLMADPDVSKAIETVQKYESNSEVKAAIATFQQAAALIADSQTS